VVRPTTKPSLPAIAINATRESPSVPTARRPLLARRSTQVGETSCLTLVWAVLDLYITNATNGIKFTQLERQRLKQIRYEGHEETIPEEVTAA
jgi:hypothetical protein